MMIPNNKTEMKERKLNHQPRKNSLKKARCLLFLKKEKSHLRHNLNISSQILVKIS